MTKSAAFLCASILLLAGFCQAQSLVPRAYLIVPTDSNAVTLAYTFSDGEVNLDPTAPIKDLRGTLHTPVFSYYHSFSFFGRSANVVASVPYVVANFDGTFLNEPAKAHRSGMLDGAARLSVNLLGGPAMTLKEYGAWAKTSRRTLLGASFTVQAPTGQYDNSKLINPGLNRWAFKPELGFSQRRNKWILDAYAGVWLFTDNNDYLTNSPYVSGGPHTSSQEPIGAAEFHVSYDMKPGWWASFDVNYWYGGSKTVDGVPSQGDLQSNSRIGGTFSLRLSRRQTLKFSYSQGAVVRAGGDFRSVALAWQYNWFGKGAMK